MRAAMEWIDNAGWQGDLIVFGSFLLVALFLASLERRDL